MRLEIPTCPACGKRAAYIVESMLCNYGIEPEHEDDSTFDYTGDYEDFGDTAEPVRDSENRATVGCADGHDWQTSSE